MSDLIDWQACVDTAPYGVLVMDHIGKVQYANPMALLLLGLPSPNGSFANEWLSDLGEANRDLLLETIAQRGQAQIHLRQREHPYLVFDIAPLDDESAVLAYIHRDYDAEASQDIGILVHDLRKPLTSIMGYATMLTTIGSESLNDMQQQFIETINRNVQRLNSNLSAVQDMSHLERNRIKLTLTPQKPIKVVTRLLKELEPLVEEKGHEITQDFPVDLPPVNADTERFDQILHILLENALRYTPSGGQIRLRGHAVNSMVQIDIADNGIGIPTNEQEKVFSKFFRGEDELINQYHGLGLNLYIARGLVQLHGGQLWFKSELGRGSTFSFTIPVTQ